MPITEKQRQTRQGRAFGSSDLAALLGLDPYRTAYDVVAYHAGLTDTQHGFTSDAADLGNRFEPVVLDWAEEQLGPIKRNQERRVPGLHIVAHIDGIVVATGIPVEAKTHAILSGRPSEEWGDEGTDEVPDPTVIQGHVHMLATEKDQCHVPAAIGTRGFLMFIVRFSPVIAKAITEADAKYWPMVEAKALPTDSQPQSTIRYLRRQPGSVAQIPQDLMDAYLSLAETEKVAEKATKEAKKAILAALGTAEAALAPDGRAFTYFEFEVDEKVHKGYKARKLIYRPKGINIPEKGASDGT